MYIASRRLPILGLRSIPIQETKETTAAIGGKRRSRRRLAGCGSYLAFKLLVLVVMAGFGLYRADQAGVGPDVFVKQPALAVAAIGVMAHTNYEFIELDKYRGTVTLRQVDSGQTVTLRPEQLLRPDVLESGERIGNLFGGNGARSGIPEWVPQYPGARPQGVVRQDAQGIRRGVATFEASAAAGRIADYYDRTLREAGLEVSRAEESSSIKLRGSGGEGSREVVVVVSSQGITSAIRITFSESG